MNKTISYIYVILSAVCWGFIGFSNRLLTEAGMTLGNRVFVRNFGTLLVLTVVFALFHRQVFRIRLKHLPIFLGSGLISILLLSVVYFQCQTMCSLSVAAVLLYLAPSFVVLASAVLWKTPLTKGKIAALCVSLLGCVMVSGIFGGDMTASWAGIGLGVVSGMCYASYTVFSHYGLAHYESYTMIYWTFLVAGFGSVFFADIPALLPAFRQPQGIIGGICVVVVAGSATNEFVASLLLENARAPAAVPTRAASEAEARIWLRRSAARAASRMERRVWGAISLIFSAMAGSSPKTTASLPADCTARTARTE